MEYEFVAVVYSTVFVEPKKTGRDLVTFVRTGPRRVCRETGDRAEVELEMLKEAAFVSDEELEPSKLTDGRSKV